MDDRFTHYSEPIEVLADSGRMVHVGVGEVGGMELAWLGVNKENILLTLPELRSLIESLGYCDPEHSARTSGYYLYKVVITEYPDGSWWEDGVHRGLDPDWAPEGWEADADWIDRFNTTRFFWPSTKREYRSKSSAQARAKLIESYGAKTRIDRSSLITWPLPDDVEEIW